MEMPTEADDERATRARADLLTAFVLVGLGLTIVYLSWTMPRLEARHVHPATIPGLVPLILGGVLTLCSGLLVLRSWRIKAPNGWRGLASLFATRQALRVAVVLGLALFHTLVLVGWLPFWAAAALFIFVFIVVFEVWLGDSPGSLLHSAIWGLLIAVVAGGGIAFVFEHIFLVRLP